MEATNGKVSFQTNLPEEVALAYDPPGKEVEGNYGPQVFFTCADGRKMYLPPIAAERIEDLRIRKGERFEITKAEVKNGARRSIEWQVKRVDPPAAPAPTTPTVNGASTPNGHPSAGANHSAPSYSTRCGEMLVGRVVTHANGNGHAAPAVATKAPYAQAMSEFLLIAGEATRAAEIELGKPGGSVRFDNRDVAALATTMFIQAAREGWLTWRPR